MQNHNDDTIITSDTVLRKIYLSLYWKGCVWEQVGERTKLQHIDPHFIGHNRVSFPFSWAVQPGAWGPSLSGCWFSLPHLISNSSDPQLVWSPNCNSSIGGLRAHSAGCWLSLPHLVSNSSDPQLLSRGPEDPLCLMLAFSTASCHQRVWSPN